MSLADIRLQQITESCVVRILTYVKRIRYSPECVDLLKRQGTDGQLLRSPDFPDDVVNYCSDLTVEVESVICERKFSALIYHGGSNPCFATLDEARYHVLAEIGVLPDIIPENLAKAPSAQGASGLVVAMKVLEFLPTTKPCEAVRMESCLKSILKGPAEPPIGPSPSGYKQ
jgi:hypothetical protein